MPYYRITDHHIYTMHCSNQNLCYFGGTSGTLLKISNGGILLGTEKENNILPDGFSLYQNYPNPFNSATKIKFDIPAVETGLRPVSTRLVVYDPLGREVALLVNEALAPGTYEIEWDARDVPSGVYFYTLSARTFTESKRMVLLK
jgi:hypothetical protein